jgi:lysophospholipase L1-like esterase
VNPLFPLFLYFASGESLYLGVGLLIMAIVMSSFRKPYWLPYARILATWIGVAMIVMASPPLSRNVVIFLVIIFFIWLVTSAKSRATSWISLQTFTSCVLLVSVLVLCAIEYRHRRMPKMHTQIDDHLVVLGDSISAGVGGSTATWPSIMQTVTGVEVKNLSKAGAVVADGFVMAERIGPRDHLILVELGGNDLLSGEPLEIFSGNLERLMMRIVVPGRTVVMFELPLIPTAVAYGQAQRRIAAKYGVVLIPKRFLVYALSGRDATYDGIHLTNAGATRMAAIVAEIFSQSFRTHF